MENIISHKILNIYIYTVYFYTIIENLKMFRCVQMCQNTVSQLTLNIKLTMLANRIAFAFNINVTFFGD